jgi:hypothetical protein
MRKAGVRAELFARPQYVGCQRDLAFAERIERMTGVHPGGVFSGQHDRTKFCKSSASYAGRALAS